MGTFSFRIRLADTDQIVDDMTQEKLLEMSDAIFEAGCDDSTPGVSCGVVFVDFDREAKTLREAIESAHDRRIVVLYVVNANSARFVTIRLQAN